MSLEGKVLLDRSEARLKCLRALGKPEAACPALAFSRGWLAVFGAVIDSGAGFDEHILDVRQFGDLRLSGRIATQLVGDALDRHFRTCHQYAVDKTAWPQPCRDASATGYRVRRRADRRLASAEKARRPSVTNTLSRCQAVYGLRRAVLTRRAKPVSNLSHQ